VGGNGWEEEGGKKRAGGKGQENKTKGGRKRVVDRIRTRGWKRAVGRIRTRGRKRAVDKIRTRGWMHCSMR
jgi:hypothetical protein